MRGRRAEFETVLGLLDSTQQGQGQVLLVEGGPLGPRLRGERHQGVLLSAAGRDDEAIRCLQEAWPRQRTLPGCVM